MKKKCFVVDIDQTIANSDHRSHHLQGQIKDWDKYFSECGFDKPITKNINFLRSLYFSNLIAIPDLKILFLSNRPDTIENETMIWLKANMMMDYGIRLMLRPKNLWLLNHVFKEQAMKTIIQDWEPILYYDDNPESCKAIQALLPNCVVLGAYQ